MGANSAQLEYGESVFKLDIGPHFTCPLHYSADRPLYMVIFSLISDFTYRKNGKLDDFLLNSHINFFGVS